MATIIEAPLDLQDSVTLPQNHLQACQAQDIPTRGNAAGNTVDLFDLDGENVSPPPLPPGFTTRGVVALVFSCVSAFVGLAVIVWYGMLPISGGGMVEKRAVGGNGPSSDGSMQTADGTVEQISTAPKTD